MPPFDADAAAGGYRAAIATDTRILAQRTAPIWVRGLHAFWDGEVGRLTTRGAGRTPADTELQGQLCY